MKILSQSPKSVRWLWTSDWAARVFKIILGRGEVVPQEGSLQVPFSAGWLLVTAGSEAVFVAALAEESEGRLDSWNSFALTAKNML